MQTTQEGASSCRRRPVLKSTLVVANGPFAAAYVWQGQQSKHNVRALSGRDAIYYAIRPRVKLSRRAYLRASSTCASLLNTRAHFLTVFHPIAAARHRVHYARLFAEIGEMRFNGWTRLFAYFRVLILRRIEEVIADGVMWSNFACAMLEWPTSRKSTLSNLNTFLSDIRK